MWLEVPELSLDSKWKAMGANLLARTSFAYSYRRANYVISISKTTDKIFKNRYPELGHKSNIISHHDVFFQDPKTTENFEQAYLNKELPKRYILSLGNTKPYKNVEGAIKAFAKICDRHPDVGMVIAGRNDRRAVLTELAKSLNVLDRIYFLKNQISENDLKLLIKNAICMAFLSFYEGYGIPILEAISLGCPVLGSTADIVVETSGGAGAYADPYNIDEIAQMMDKIIKEPEFRNSLIKGGYDYLESIKNYDSLAMTHNLYLN